MLFGFQIVRPTFLHIHQGAGPLMVAGAVIVGAIAAGIYVERLCFAPMKAGAGIASMVSSFAIWMQLEQAAVLVLPRHTYPFPPLSTAMPLEGADRDDDRRARLQAVGQVQPAHHAENQRKAQCQQAKGRADHQSVGGVLQKVAASNLPNTVESPPRIG